MVRRLFEHDRGYIFQTGDGRVVFALPFAEGFTLIGTTDQAFSGDPGGVTPSAEEIDYLCAAANGYFRAQISPADVDLGICRRAFALRRRLEESAGYDARLRAQPR